METNSDSELQLRRCSEDANDTGDPIMGECETTGGSGSIAGGARYKLMSPAKLPISRSPCITIPPGLSPTSFLESPVLLSNVKVEPSPTTGSFARSLALQGSRGLTSYSTSISSDTVCERKSSGYELITQDRLNMVSADINHRRREQFDQAQGQSLASSSSIRNEMAVLSNDLSLSSPMDMIASRTSAPAAEGDVDELNQTGSFSCGLQSSSSDLKVGSGSSVSADDGYNWRKYGQKLVKGCEFPRSYYKCTHPNCEVKKLFERSHDGQITEIIYKGTHDHPKPQPNRRHATGVALIVPEERSDKIASLPGQDDKLDGISSQVSHTADPNGTLDLSPVAANDDGAEGGEDDDDPFSKRRKMEAGGFDITPVVKPIREPRVVVQTVSEVDILDDGYRWRKYGQKVVRGNPNPRSYYKCTHAGCPVRKHVERASHDPKAVITTYEGKHNHDVPTARSSGHDTVGPTTANAQLRIKHGESEAISLDLGVGIRSTADDRLNGHHQRLQIQEQSMASGSTVLQANPITAYYGVLDGGLIQYGSRQNTSESLNVQAPNLCPENLRLLTGP